MKHKETEQSKFVLIGVWDIATRVFRVVRVSVTKTVHFLSFLIMAADVLLFLIP